MLVELRAVCACVCCCCRWRSCKRSWACWPPPPSFGRRLQSSSARGGRTGGAPAQRAAIGGRFVRCFARWLALRVRVRCGSSAFQSLRCSPRTKRFARSAHCFVLPARATAGRRHARRQASSGKTSRACRLSTVTARAHSSSLTCYVIEAARRCKLHAIPQRVSIPSSTSVV